MEKPRSRLGRGLGSLLNVTTAPPEPAQAVLQNESKSDAQSPAALADGQVVRVSVDAVHPNPHQPRRLFDAERLRELAASLKSSGLVQPVIVRRQDDGFQLIAGERRLRAAKLAGLSDIPAIIREVSSFEQAQMALIENIQREDLNPIERAQSYQALIQQLGLTQAELASRLGEDRSIIANHLRLIQLPQTVIDLLASGQLSLGHGKLLAGVESPAEQERLAKLVVDQDLSVRNLERQISAFPEIQAESRSREGAKLHRQDLERSLSRQLGVRVEVRSGSKGKGRLIVHYESLDEFGSLMARFNCTIEE
jgi:ParB family transcriptional regulator, chromosome partitioning protein